MKNIKKTNFFKSKVKRQKAKFIKSKVKSQRSKVSYLFYFLLFTFYFAALPVVAQSGGPFEITQSVVSIGGGASSGGSYSVTGTQSQPFAGTNSSGGQFVARGGFWQPVIAPTAAMVALSGRVLSANGGGIRNVFVTLTDASGTMRRSPSTTFGYFRFDDVEAGQTYIVTVSSKRFQFINNTQVVFVADEIIGLTFNALPE